MIQSRSDLSNKKIFYVLTKALASTWKEKSHAYINDASCIPVSLINSVLIRNTTGSKNVLEDTIKEKN